MTSRLKTSLARKYYKYFSSTRYKIAKVNGTEFCIRPDNYIDRHLWIEGRYEKEQIQTLIHAAKQKKFDAFLDIGTNFGLYSCIIGNSELLPVIHSFECDPRNLFQLYGHIAMNNLTDKIKVHPYAAGNNKDEKSFSLADKNNSGTSKIIDQSVVSNDVIKVSQVSIDEHLKLEGQKLLIKIDVEGYEKNVLEGMVNTLKNNQCFIQIEIWKDNKEVIEGILKKLNYKKIKNISADYYFTNMDNIEL